MKVKDLVAVTQASMPMTIELNNETLFYTNALYFGGYCMVPEIVMRMEIVLVSLSPNGDGLVVEVR